MKVGGSLAFWVKVAIGIAILALLWFIYRKLAGAGESIGAAAAKVAEVAKDVILPPSDVDPRIVAARYDESTDTIYDPALDTRSTWDKIWTNEPASAYRPLTDEERTALAKARE